MSTTDTLPADDSQLIEIAAVYTQLLKIYEDLIDFWSDDDEPILPILDHFLAAADKIEPQTLEGCAAKISMIRINEKLEAESEYVFDRIQGSTILAARKILTRVRPTRLDRGESQRMSEGQKRRRKAKMRKS